jgi:hypothetical protein
MAHTANISAKVTGYSYLANANANYTTCRNAASASSGYTDYVNVYQVLDGGTYSVSRGPLVFDTSTIPAGSVVTSCLLYLYAQNVYAGACNIVIQSGQPTYPHDPVVLGDFDYSRYSGDGGSKDATSFSPYGHWGYITMNSTGRGWIQCGGTTQLILRTSTDIAAAAPGGTTQGATFSFDSGHYPYLAVTWTEVTEASAAITAAQSVTASANQVFSAVAAITPRMSVFISTAVHLLEAAVSIVGRVSLLIDGAVWQGTLFEYLGSLAPGAVLVIDCDQQLLTVNSVNDMKNMDGEWISLGPGVNEVTFTDSEAARTLGVTVVYKDRWV